MDCLMAVLVSQTLALRTETVIGLAPVGTIVKSTIGNVLVNILCKYTYANLHKPLSFMFTYCA